MASMPNTGRDRELEEIIRKRRNVSKENPLRNVPSATRGASIGADRRRQRTINRGMSPEQADRFLASLARNQQEFGTETPSIGMFVHRGMQQNDARQGVPGISRMPVDALSTAGAMALGPAVMGTRFLGPGVQTVRSGASGVASRVPGVMPAHRLATRLDPARMFGRGVGPAVAAKAGTNELAADVQELVNMGVQTPGTSSLSLLRDSRLLPGYTRVLAPIISSSGR
mgnify:CR=1 FL=1